MNDPNAPKPDPRDVSTETREQMPATASAGIPKRIGQYSIKRAIGSGGMGTVYEALQEKPRRTVALKLMRAGIASRSALRRFEYESQLLARLRHPGIAQVYNAGTHRDGEVTVPYFAMEYIVGAKPVTDYVKDKKLGTRERMKLFASVCEAVHHGHQKGIIHRDLKPSNILVDSSGQVKIIDFGVARCTDSDMAVTTLQTDVGQLIGTLQYMSPEQCAADPHDIDTRSDVYALGVVFYEMLCERLPYELKGAALHEATRVIREQEPAKLSTFNKALRGDVETIVLKALEKDRDRRYESASALTADIKRYLNNEPISARPASVIYQLRVFARRNKGIFASIAVVFVILVAATIVSTGQYLSAELARQEALIAAEEATRDRDRAVEAEQRAEKQKREANAQRQSAQETLGFLRNMLNSVSPFGRLGRGATVEQLLDSVAGDIDTEFSRRPLIAGILHHTVGGTYFGLGNYKTAETHLRKALRIKENMLGRNHIETAEVLFQLGWLLFQESRYEEAEKAHSDAAAIFETALGPDDWQTLRAKNGLGAAINNRGRPEEAEKLLSTVVEIQKRTLGALHTSTLETMQDLARSIAHQGRFAEAESLFRETWEGGRTTRGEDHPLTLFAMDGLASVLGALEKFTEAEQLCQRALSIRRRVMGTDHFWTIQSIQTLSQIMFDQERLEQALELCHEAKTILSETFGRAHLKTLEAIKDVGLVLQTMGKHAEAEPYYREALEGRRRVLGDDHPHTLNSINSLAFILDSMGKYTEALSLQREVLASTRRAKGDDHPYTLLLTNNLGSVLNNLSRHDEAAEVLSAGETAARTVYVGDDAKWLGNYLAKLGEAGIGQGEFAEAEKTLLEAHGLLAAGFGDDHARTTKTINHLVTLYESWDAAEPGQGYDAKAAEWRKKLPEENGE